MTFWRMPDSVRLRSRAAMWSERRRANGIFRVKICLLNPQCIFVFHRNVTCWPARRVRWWRWYTAIRAVNHSSVAATAHYSCRRRLRGGWSAMSGFINSAACRTLQGDSLSMVYTTVTRCSVTPTIWRALSYPIFTARTTGGIRAKISIWIILRQTVFIRFARIKRSRATCLSVALAHRPPIMRRSTAATVSCYITYRNN